MSDSSQRYRESGRAGRSDNDGFARTGAGSGTGGRDNAPSRSGEPAREPARADSTLAEAEELPPKSASTRTRGESQNQGRSAKRMHGLLVPLIVVCVTGLVLALAARVIHPFRAAASVGPTSTGSAPSSGSANTLGLSSTDAGATSATAAVSPAVLTQTVQSTDTLPGSLSLNWPDATESAVAMEGVGTMATHGTPDKPVPIASVTKTMTAYLVLKDHPMAPGQSGSTLTVEAAEAGAYSQEAALNQSLVPVKAGEDLTELQALQALMLASADNVAQILGRWDAGSDSAFVAEMNSAAAALGMTDTHFTDPSGYDSGTRSSANDLIKLGEAAMAVPDFAQIVDEGSAQIPLAGTVTNYNRLLGDDGVVGIKTGSTQAAGGCLLFAAKHEVDGQSVIVIGVVLGAPGSNATAELKNVLAGSESLLDSAENQLREFTLFKQGAQVATGPSPTSSSSPGSANSPGSPGSPSGSGAAGSGAAAVPLGPADLVSLIGWPGLTLTIKTSTGTSGPVLSVIAPNGTSLGTTQLTAI